LKYLFTILILFFYCFTIQAQQGISFQHLNTSNGLSYLGVTYTCVDKKGNLWAATGNGLNMFNGKTVEKYFVADYPQLKNNNIAFVTCDNKNRIWILSSGGSVSMLDEQRQLHKVSLYENNTPIRVRWILNLQSAGIGLFTNSGNYIFNKEVAYDPTDSLTQQQFTQVRINGYDSISPNSFRQIEYASGDSYFFIQEDAYYKVNFATGTVGKKYNIQHCTFLCAWENSGLLLYDRIASEVKIFDLATEQFESPFKDLRDQFGNTINTWVNTAKKINTHQYLFTTLNSGIYIYNTQSKKIYNYTHNIADPASLGNDATTTVAVGQKGWVFVTCNPSGISYFNCNDIVGNQNIFTDKKGNGYDGYIAGIATKDNNSYFIGTGEGLLKWERNTNTTTFINYPGEKGQPLLKRQEVTSILIDDKKRAWISVLTEGILVIDKNLNIVKFIKNTSRSKTTIKLKKINYLHEGPDGYIWVCGANGLCRINPRTFEVDNFDNSPLSKLDSTYCVPFVFTDSNNLWVATYGSGAYHYNLTTQKLEVYTTAKGLSNNGIFSIGADKDKNIYIGTRAGLNILFTDGRMKTITQKDGLFIDRIEGLLLDKHNRMWIGNDIGLAVYDPKDSSIKTFDERYGLSIYGFRVGSYFQTPNGEFVFGTPNGIQYFHPDSLYNKKIVLNALINKIETRNIISNITESTSFELSPSDNQVTFYFGSVDYSQHQRTYYEYKLVDIDKDWVKVTDQHAVHYNSLSPGKYIFKVRISSDSKNWQEAENEVTIIIATPVYKTWWFRLLASLLGFITIAYVVNYYRKQQLDKRNHLETELVITYFASQINSHKNTDDLLWDVAKNCISRLNFEDCVIYLKDEARNVLVQKAAYGPKNPVDFTIHQPIEIPVGMGITGTVAQTGVAEIVNDTASDKRYIVDDDMRRSEIAVPIIIDDKIVGVIDSEHHQRNFFSAKHSSILQTIAVLCANQIQKTKAEEEKQKATIELWENKQKATESRLQSLRLQMNPHFLFNALNSIQQMILSNEEMVATRYLSRFSKLLRMVLLHSDKESITLREEIDILRMYIELESVRFKESFSYSINCDEDIETEEIKIPTLLIQPFVENAIWHGLMHKENDRKLTVTFTEKGDFLQCIIEDNGVGRKKASVIKSLTGSDKKHTSKGIAVSEERLKTIKNSSGLHGSIEIVDLNDDGGEGTLVIINFPI
jgi:ligand-binding sensor domain-containing protein/putative methionine-R-sulfoxide reductase with GAF domain/anti-sigma regulatory factor (Ser/Thr protein kinase)